MSLTRTTVISSAAGLALAWGAYAVASPAPRDVLTVEDLGPVPTPTVSVLADCVAPAKLEKGICVTRVAGPVVVKTLAPPPQAPVPAGPGTTGPTTPTTHDGDDSYEDDDESEHEDSEDSEDHEDHDAEDHGSEDEHEDN